VSQWTLLDVLKWTTTYFKSHEIDNPRSDAEILLAFSLKVNRIDLYLRYDQPMNATELAAFKTLIKRRAQREPVSYIVGTKEFWSLELHVSREVLIPRPDTECLVEAALPFLAGDRSARVLELGTGTGAVSIALSSERAEHQFFASDRSKSALRLAVKNAKRHRLADRICFFVGEWLQPVDASRSGFDMIVSNPPYVRTEDLSRLQPEINAFEPHLALDGGEDGLAGIRRIVVDAHHYLKPDGVLILEMGCDQREGVEKIVDSVGRYDRVRFTKDYSGHDRVVLLRRKTNQ